MFYCDDDWIMISVFDWEGANNIRKCKYLLVVCVQCLYIILTMGTL